MIEGATDFDKIQEEMWESFIPMLLDTADKINFDYELIKNEEIKIIEFKPKKSGNIFHLLTGLKDALGCRYFRFLSKICEFKEELDLYKFLKGSEILGFSLYIDDKMYDSALCLKYDHPTIGGFPDSVWFEYFLRLFDANVTVIKDEVSSESNENNNDTDLIDKDVSGNSFFCGNCNGEMELTKQELRDGKFVCADCGYLNQI